MINDTTLHRSASFDKMKLFHYKKQKTISVFLWSIIACIAQRPCYFAHSINHESTTTTSSSTSCEIKANAGECNSNPTYMLEHCSMECYQSADLATIGYYGGGKQVMSKLKCENIHEVFDDKGKESCDNMAAMGECASDPGFMLFNCAKSCYSCVGPG